MLTKSCPQTAQTARASGSGANPAPLEVPEDLSARVTDQIFRTLSRFQERFGELSEDETESVIRLTRQDHTDWIGRNWHRWGAGGRSAIRNPVGYLVTLFRIFRVGTPEERDKALTREESEQSAKRRHELERRALATKMLDEKEFLEALPAAWASLPDRFKEKALFELKARLAKRHRAVDADQTTKEARQATIEAGRLLEKEWQSLVKMVAMLSGLEVPKHLRIEKVRELLEQSNDLDP